jgi:hypothetical protein
MPLVVQILPELGGEVWLRDRGQQREPQYPFHQWYQGRDGRAVFGAAGGMLPRDRDTVEACGVCSSSRCFTATRIPVVLP